MSLKPITLYSHFGGPNPWKVALVLEELQVPYTNDFVDFSKLKTPEFESKWINGRVPAIEDPNTNTTLGESGAIIEYLIATYDKDHRLSYPDKSPEYFQTLQWLHFQMSGQGPYFGQSIWFLRYHPEQIESAKERYLNEIERVWGVLDRHLAQSPAGVLVGDKVTFADFSFVPWDVIVQDVFPDRLKPVAEKLPHFSRWHKALLARPLVADVLRRRQEAIKAAGH